MDAAEGLITETRDLAKQINSKVHEQRADLIEINEHVEEAKDNAEAAEENIISAQAD